MNGLCPFFSNDDFFLIIQSCSSRNNAFKTWGLHVQVIVKIRITCTCNPQHIQVILEAGITSMQRFWDLFSLSRWMVIITCRSPKSLFKRKQGCHAQENDGCFTRHLVTHVISNQNKGNEWARKKTVPGKPQSRLSHIFCFGGREALYSWPSKFVNL